MLKGPTQGVGGVALGIATAALVGIVASAAEARSPLRVDETLCTTDRIVGASQPKRVRGARSPAGEAEARADWRDKALKAIVAEARDAYGVVAARGARIRVRGTPNATLFVARLRPERGARRDCVREGGRLTCRFDAAACVPVALHRP